MRFLAGLFLPLLVVVSWPLWLPQSAFPQIPLSSGFVLPDLVAIVSLGVLLTASLRLSATSSGAELGRASPLLVIVTATLLCLEDQHRCQPWLVHFGWIMLFLAVSPRVCIERLMVALTVSIYLGSAISKLNPLFSEQHGSLILTGIDKLAGTSWQTLDESRRTWICRVMPIGEILIAALLVVPRLRRFGGLLSLLMHTLLALIFSPLGLDHEWGVVVWNIYFVLQSLMLWLVPPRSLSDSSPRGGFLTPVLIVLLLLPLAARPFGLVDDWVGWSLYSPRREVVRLRLTDPPDALSNAHRELLTRSSSLVQQMNGTSTFMLDRWSLRALGVPLNPSSRIEYGVAIALCQKYDAWDSATIEYEQRDLFDKNPKITHTATGQREIVAGAARFRLNVFTGPRYLQTTREDQ